MRHILDNMPPVGFVVIVIIALLFVLSLVMLFHVYLRYRILAGKATGEDAEETRGFRGALLESYTAAYKKYGQDVNTPAIITETIGNRLGGLLFCECFLNNAVSLFVTLGLFGTFLGLSLSVASLTELIGFSNNTEWLSVLDSIGGGLMSALSGMGVAFYTSLVGVICAILLTILRTIFNPETERERLETRLELWLDTEIAPTLYTEAAKDEVQLINRLIDSLNTTVGDIRTVLDASAASYTEATQAACSSMERTVDSNKKVMVAFNQTVDKFNSGVHDFHEVDYNLRGSVERMDLAVRDLAAALREITRRTGGTKQ